MIKCLAALVALALVTQCSAQSPMPSIVDNQGRHTLLVDGKPFFILGGQAHNSSAWPALLPQVWTAIEHMHANTLEVPVYWEQLEPQEGKFDFSLVDTLLTQAQAHHTRLVLLWFATWKNGSDHYMPAWMKLQAAKYPNCIGVKGDPIDSPSPIAVATLEADKKAFTAFMGYLKKADPNHTVIMVQVENEPGAWGTVRDYSPAAQRLFEKPVPEALLQPEIRKALGHPDASVGVRHFGDGTGHPMASDGAADAAGSGSIADGSAHAAAGSWSRVFGADADEYFQAWYVARFIGEVAAAGKAIYPLPLYVNVALRDPLTHPTANTYESGGATDNVIPIYKVAAPAIDLVAPDIYLPENDKCQKVIDLYTRPDNALLVPEAALTGDKTKYLYDVLAHGGIGFSPFGIDDNGGKSPGAPDSCTAFGEQYALLAPLLPQLAAWAAQGKISALLEPDDHTDQTTELDGWQARAIFGAGRGDHRHPNGRSTGKVLIIQQDRNTFLVTGTLARITFKPAAAGGGQGGRAEAGKAWQYLRVEEGSYKDGVFTPSRILNGDETDWGGPAFGPTPTLIRITLNTR
ncbi:MAG TPA: DUF5597 domain-containing protein [Puia sp.]|nr:DUF5597 domain-containing protein [Puia sp.]